MNFVVIDGVRYSKDLKVCLGCDKCTIEEVNILEGVETIEDFSFRYCKNLKKVILPSTLKEVGKFAFDGCSALEKLVFCPSIKRIPASSVKDCPKLTVYSDFLSVLHDSNEPIEGYKLPAFAKYDINDFYEFIQTLTDELDGIFTKTEINEIVKKEVYELSFM